MLLTEELADSTPSATIALSGRVLAVWTRSFAVSSLSKFLVKTTLGGYRKSVRIVALVEQVALLNQSADNVAEVLLIGIFVVALSALHFGRYPITRESIFAL